MNNFILKSYNIQKLKEYTINFLSKLFCNHLYDKKCVECLKIINKEKYNVFYVGDFKNSIKKEKFLEIINIFSFSNEQINEKKILVVQGLEFATISAQNSLLTWIENIYQNTILIFLTSNYNKIIETIKSRLFFLDLDNSHKDYSLNVSEQYYNNLFLSSDHDKIISLFEFLVKFDKFELNLVLNKFAINILNLNVKNNIQIANYISKLIYQLENNINSNKKILIEKFLIDIFNNNGV